MSTTNSQIYIQIVFTVKERECVITEEFRYELQSCISAIVEEHHTQVYAIYCMPDHVHVFVCIKPSVSIEELVRDIKSGSAAFINNGKYMKDKFSWQEDYGAFSYSHSHIDKVVKYIENQKEHHAETNFQEEYVAFLEKFGIQFEERYLFEWV